MSRLSVSGCLVVLTMTLGATISQQPSLDAAAQPAIGLSQAAAQQAEIPEVLKGNTWLRHHREDLMPYWDMPEALGVPMGNFPSFRGRNGELLPEGNTNRGLSTLARGVYGYSLAFMLTGEEKYLTYAKSGLDWINTKAKDPVYGGYYGELGCPRQPGGSTGQQGRVRPRLVGARLRDVLQRDPRSGCGGRSARRARPAHGRPTTTPRTTGSGTR